MEIVESDIRIKKCSKSEPVLSIYIARHIGEALGFAANNVPGSLMFRTTTAATKFHADDKSAICTAYPAAGNSCTSTKECPGGLACVSGKCAQCTQSDQCGANATCDGGSCVRSCKQSSECQGGQVCRGGKCQGCLNDDECGKKAYCDEDVCLPSCESNDDCNTDEECKSDGRCVRSGGCKTHKHCKASEYCQNEKCMDRSLLGKTCKGEVDCINGQICMTDQGKSFCTFWCNKQGTACPDGFKCAPFDDERGFCTIDNKPKPTDKKDGDKKEGGGCSATPHTDPNTSGWLLLFSVFFFLQLLRRRRR